MRSVLFGVVALVALAFPATALGGGYSTVELSSTPDGLRAGETWRVEIAVLAHGRMPMEGLKPTPRVKITEVSSGESRTFTSHGGEAGRYRARVTFPGAGKWAYSIEPYGQWTYPAVEIGSHASTGGAGSERAGWALPAGIVAGLGAALLTLRTRPRRRSGLPGREAA